LTKKVICQITEEKGVKYLIMPSDAVDELGCELCRSVLIKCGTAHPYGEEYFKALVGDDVLSGLYKLISDVD
jgi:hypothetical protein